MDATSLLRPAEDSTDEVRDEVVYQVVGRLSGVASIPRALDVTLDSYFKSRGFVNVGLASAVWRRPAGHSHQRYPRRISYE